MTVNNEKSSWKSKSGYVWAMIGSAVGFANILGFGAKSYQNGGAAFLIPLTIAAVILGVPLLILEGVMGQKFQKPLVGAYESVFGNTGKFFGWLTIFGVFTIGAYYCILSVWTLMYLFFSGTNQISENTQEFFSSQILLNYDTTHINQFSWPIALISIALLLYTYRVCAKKISSGIETLCKFILPLLFCILILFFVCVLFLPGALNGIQYFIVPNFKQILNLDVWILAFGHIFFSFSVGLGIISGYSQYAQKEINIVKSMIFVALGDIITSLVAGVVIFGGLGYMAEYSNLPFTEVVSSSIFSLGFIVFPKVIQTFSPMISQIFGVLFFVSLFIAGFSGLISIVEAVVGNLEYVFNWKRRFATKVCISLMTLVTLIFCFGNGAYLIGVIDEMTSGINVILAGILEIFVFLYLSKTISNHSVWFKNGKRVYFYYSLKYISPAFLLFLLASQLKREFTHINSPEVIIRWSWFLTVAILSYIFMKISTKSKTTLIKPIDRAELF